MGEINGNTIYVDRDVDLVNSEYICINAKQGDTKTRYLRLKIYSEGRLLPLSSTDGFTSNVRFKKPDGHFVLNPNTIDDEGRIVIPLTFQMLYVSGTAQADITLELNDTVISTMIFLVNIVGKPVTDEDIESTDEFKALVLSAEEAKRWALMSQSYAVGGTGVPMREGEDTDNSKYYWEQFKESNNSRLWVGTKAEYLANQSKIMDKTLVILTDVAGAVGAIDGTTSLAKLKIPTISTSSFTYDGDFKTPTFNNFDVNTMVKNNDSDITAKNADTYEIIIELKDPTSYMWEDGTADPQHYTWKITPKSVSKPSIRTVDNTYTGEMMSPSMYYYDENIMSRSGSIQGRECGIYTMSISLKDHVNYIWNDNTIDDFPLTWKIVPIKISNPYISSSYTYTGESITPTITNYTGSSYISKMKLSGTTSAVNAGTYNLSIDLIDKDHYIWGDETTSTKSLAWTIQKKSLTKPTLSKTEYTWTGSTIIPSFNNDNAQYIIKANSKPDDQLVEVAQYNTTIELKDTTNTIWSDNTTTSFKLYWNIVMVKLTKPTVTNNTFTYDGTVKRPTYNYYDSTLIDCQGHMEAFTADTYDLVFTIKDTTHYTWSDGSGAVQVNAQWVIKPLATPAPTINPQSFSYDGSVKTPTVIGLDNSLVNVLSTSTLSASAAGSYIITFSLKDKINYTWSDGTTGDVDRHWAITTTTTTT